MKDAGWLTVWRNNQQTWIVLGLCLAAIALYTVGLGDVALRDWDEAIVAQVARNIEGDFPQGQTWLYPTIDYGQPYWNKPPLVHWLIAIAYSLFGVSEWSTRIVPALLSATSVWLLYKITQELALSNIACWLTSCVYLTLLPIARHGRLAMLDGAITCWFCLAVWCLLRGRKDQRWLLGTGLGLGFICLTKGIMMGVLLGGIILLFLVGDCPQMLFSFYLWGSFILGLIPAIAWYGLQYLHYGADFWATSLGKQTFNRIWEPVTPLNSPPWFYLLEILKYTFPWLIFLPQGLKLAIQNRHLSWAKLALLWSGIYLLAISLMVTKLPWYLIPIYPSFALLIGVALATAWQSNTYPRSWQLGLTLVTVVGCLGGLYFNFTAESATDLKIILAIAIGSLIISTILIWRTSPYFIVVLLAGFYLALWLLFNSNHWLWELNEAFPVKPVAEMIEEYTPPQQTVYTTYPYLRPSLNFYSDRVVIPASDQQLQTLWQSPQTNYFLLDHQAIARLNLKSYTILGDTSQPETWILITH